MRVQDTKTGHHSFPFPISKRLGGDLGNLLFRNCPKQMHEVLASCEQLFTGHLKLAG